MTAAAGGGEDGVPQGFFIDALNRRRQTKEGRYKQSILQSDGRKMSFLMF